MKKIQEKEDELFERWESSLNDDEKNQFVRDGLCYNGKIANNGTRDYGNQEEMWINSKRKIVFLSKDSDNNPGEDYRYWDIHGGLFFGRLSMWLQRLSMVTAEYLPTIENANYLKDLDMVQDKYPFAIVNIKKQSGGSSINDDIIEQYAERDSKFLKEQVSKILKPNIVVCCGSHEGNPFMMNIAKKYIYKDKEFNDMYNYVCCLSKDQSVLLLDCYHPSYRTSNEDMINFIISQVQELIKSDQCPDFLK